MNLRKVFCMTCGAAAGLLLSLCVSAYAESHNGGFAVDAQPNDRVWFHLGDDLLLTLHDEDCPAALAGFMKPECTCFAGDITSGLVWRCDPPGMFVCESPAGGKTRWTAAKPTDVPCTFTVSTGGNGGHSRWRDLAAAAGPKVFVVGCTLYTSEGDATLWAGDETGRKELSASLAGKLRAGSKNPAGVLSAYFGARWTLRTNPDRAGLSVRSIACDIEARDTGSVSVSVTDGDLFDDDIETWNAIDFGFKGIQIDVPPCSDDDEAMAFVGYQLAAERELSWETQRIEMSSSGAHGAFRAGAEGVRTAAISAFGSQKAELRGIHGTTTSGSFMLQAEAYCPGTDTSEKTGAEIASTLQATFAVSNVRLVQPGTTASVD